jgi:hypothetical protein
LDVIGTKVLRVFLLVIHSHLYKWNLLPPSKKGLKLVCYVNTVYGNLKYENSQDYAQKPQGNCTFMNFSFRNCFEFSSPAFSGVVGGAVHVK